MASLGDRLGAAFGVPEGLPAKGFGTWAPPWGPPGPPRGPPRAPCPPRAPDAPESQNDYGIVCLLVFPLFSDSNLITSAIPYFLRKSYFCFPSFCRKYNILTTFFTSIFSVNFFTLQCRRVVVIFLVLHWTFFYPPVVARVLLFSQKKYGLKKCEKITKNAEFNKDFLGDFIF